MEKKNGWEKEKKEVKIKRNEEQRGKKGRNERINRRTAEGKKKA